MVAFQPGQNVALNQRLAQKMMERNRAKTNAGQQTYNSNQTQSYPSDSESTFQKIVNGINDTLGRNNDSDNINIESNASNSEQESTRPLTGFGSEAIADQAKVNEATKGTYFDMDPYSLSGRISDKSGLSDSIREFNKRNPSDSESTFQKIVNGINDTLGRNNDSDNINIESNASNSEQENPNAGKGEVSSYKENTGMKSKDESIADGDMNSLSYSEKREAYNKLMDEYYENNLAEKYKSMLEFLGTASPDEIADLYMADGLRDHYGFATREDALADIDRTRQQTFYDRISDPTQENMPLGMGADGIRDYAEYMIESGIVPQEAIDILPELGTSWRDENPTEEAVIATQELLESAIAASMFNALINNDTSAEDFMDMYSADELNDVLSLGNYGFSQFYDEQPENLKTISEMGYGDTLEEDPWLQANLIAEGYSPISGTYELINALSNGQYGMYERPEEERYNTIRANARQQAKEAAEAEKNKSSQE